MREVVSVKSIWSPADADAINVHVEDVVLAFETVITLSDGRVVRPRSTTFLGPIEERFEGGGEWYLPVYKGDPETKVSEWISSREIEEVRILGAFYDWPAFQDLPTELEDELIELAVDFDDVLAAENPLLWASVSRRLGEFERKLDAIMRERYAREQKERLRAYHAGRAV